MDDMTRQTLCVLLLLICCVRADLSEEEGRKDGAARLAELQKRAAKRPVINCNSEDFERFVLSSPRPYQVLALLTTGTAGGCNMCNDLAPEYEILAASYEKARSDGKDGPKHDIFFLRLDASVNFALFQKMGLTTIPHLVYIKSSKGLAKKKSWKTTLQDKLFLGGSKTADDLARLVQSRVNLRVVIERPPDEPDWMGLLIVLATVGLAVAFFSTVGARYVDPVLRNRRVYMVAAIAAYLMGISGVMYNRIAETQWIGQHGNGNPMYIHPSASSQFGIEGYIIGALNLGCGLAFIMLNSQLHRFKSAMSNGAAAVFLLIAVFLYRALRDIYTQKNGGYNYGFLWGSGGMAFE